MSGGSNPEIPSITNQQEAAPQRSDSPIMVMESYTLTFFRLYTVEMASRLNDGDVGENPQDSDVISVEPLAVSPPSSSTTESSQARTTPSASQTAEPVQADANAGKSATRGCNIFTDPKIENIAETRWYSKWCFMKGGMGDVVSKRWTSLKDAKHPKFKETALIKAQMRRAKVVKKVSKDTVVTASPPTVASYSSSLSGMRPAVETLPPLFSKRQKSIARSFLERIRKDYDAIRDPLEIHGAVARHLIKALNASHALACRVDLLDDARAEACEKERALQLQVTELKKENERLKVAANLAVKEKKEVTAQTLAEIKKHDLVQARFTRLEGEHFDISNKIQQLELVHSQTAKKMSELEKRAKDAEEALPQQIENAIYDYQLSEDFRVEAGKEAAYCLCRLQRHIRSPDEEEDEAPPAPTGAPAS
ncbi:hypothetical protein LIER_07765 [Lithospermum erythrorhizon]|uniref:Uncharacterized protein n=1 Tax=Lithospermum erythrorhizon TaxID=34254 RepID=A0AAV3PAE0_LITER